MAIADPTQAEFFSKAQPTKTNVRPNRDENGFEAAMADHARERDMERAQAEKQADAARRDEAAREKAAEEKAAEKKAAEEKAAEKANEKAVQDKAAQDKAAQDKATRENAAQDKATRENAAQDKAAQDKAAQDKATRENAAQDKAAKHGSQATADPAQGAAIAEAGGEAGRNTGDTRTSGADRANGGQAGRAAFPMQAETQQSHANTATGRAESADARASRADGTGGKQGSQASAVTQANAKGEEQTRAAQKATQQAAAQKTTESGRAREGAKETPPQTREAAEKARLAEELRLKGIRINTVSTGQTNGNGGRGGALAGPTAFAALSAAQMAESMGVATGNVTRNPNVNPVRNTTSQGAESTDSRPALAGSTRGTARSDSALLGRLLAPASGSPTGQGPTAPQTHQGTVPQSGGEVAAAGAETRAASSEQTQNTRLDLARSFAQPQGQASRAETPLPQGGNSPAPTQAQSSAAPTPGSTGSGQAFDPVLQGNQTMPQGSSAQPTDTGSANARAAQNAQGGGRQAPSQPVQQQVAVQVSRAVVNGQSQMSMKLHPAELGRVEVKLDIGDDGRVRASLTVDKPDTLDLMQRDVRSLEKALNDAGLQASGDDLEFNLRDQGDQTGEGERDFDSEMAGDDTGGADDNAEADLAEMGIVADDNVNIRI